MEEWIFAIRKKIKRRIRYNVFEMILNKVIEYGKGDKQ